MTRGVRIVKRLLDLAGSTAGIAMTWPLMIPIAIAIRLDSPGPVIFRQRRSGPLKDDASPYADGGMRGGRGYEWTSFEIYKFRTMRDDAEKGTGAVLATKGDPRITRVGGFLRKTRLDELPQFWNVLKGDMSIVGPRPERPFFVEQFKHRIPSYMLRHKVKAGITGWAQVNGWRGNTSLEKRIEFDLYYIENWSLSLDFKIMWLTVLRGRDRMNEA